MWEVAAELGSEPGFLCWPGVTLLSLLCSLPPHPTQPPCLHKALALQGKTGRLGRWACSLFCPLVAIKSYGNSIRGFGHYRTIIICTRRPPPSPTQGQTPPRSQAYTGPQTPTEPQERTGLGTYRVTDSHRTTSIHRTLGTHRARVPSPGALVVSDISTQEDVAATYMSEKCGVRVESG